MAADLVNLLSAVDIGREVGGRWLFRGVRFGLQRGDKIALVGRNGSGKSTLAAVLSGSQEPDEGEVVLNRATGGIARLEQSDIDASGENISAGEYLSAGLDALWRRGSLEDSDVSGAPKENPADREAAASEARALCRAMGLAPAVLKRPLKYFSGGMRKKIQLVLALVRREELLLLDEPTNHLDLNTVVWLEGHLRRSGKTLFLITHDRYFLEKVTRRICELEEGEFFMYPPGGYSDYLGRRLAREQARENKLKKDYKLLKKELEWLSRQPKARGTKQKARSGQIQKVKERTRLNFENQELRFQSGETRQGRRILDAVNLSLGYGDEEALFQGFTYYFRKRDRVALIGPNGCGKTTLARLLAGQLRPDTGEVIAGLNTKIAFVDQECAGLEDEKRVIDFIRQEKGQYIKLGDQRLGAGDLLDFFGFQSNRDQLIGTLSGGERRRLALTAAILENPNFLILDEPTNDLDLVTLNALEEFLTEFPGCLVVISHDRYFLDRVAETLFIFEPAKSEIISFPGTVSDYLARPGVQKGTKAARENVEAGESPEAPKVEKAGGTASPKKLSYKEQREFDRLETDIEELESAKNSLLEKIQGADPGDFEMATDLAHELETTEKKLQNAYARWEELAERAGV